MTFSPDSKWIVGASLSGAAQMWETETLAPVAQFPGFLQMIASVAFSPDGKRLLTSSAGKETIKLWDVESRQELLTLESHGSWFHPSAFSPDGNVLGSRSASLIPTFAPGVVHLWRAPSWKEIE
ncbi:MAG: PD40 domain-containing protein [Verrucomicrobia bacterium]|nr:PD40 domain-containing protein [Verrucomicrobiota bacterium]